MSCNIILHRGTMLWTAGIHRSPPRGKGVSRASSIRDTKTAPCRTAPYPGLTAVPFYIIVIITISMLLLLLLLLLSLLSSSSSSYYSSTARGPCFVSGLKALDFEPLALRPGGTLGALMAQRAFRSLRSCATWLFDAQPGVCTSAPAVRRTACFATQLIASLRSRSVPSSASTIGDSTR